MHRDDSASHLRWSNRKQNAKLLFSQEHRNCICNGFVLHAPIYTASHYGGRNSRNGGVHAIRSLPCRQRTRTHRLPARWSPTTNGDRKYFLVCQETDDISQTLTPVRPVSTYTTYAESRNTVTVLCKCMAKFVGMNQ